MSGPCPNCHNIIQGPNQPVAPPQPQPLNPPQEEVPTLFSQRESPQPTHPEAALSPPSAEPSPPQEAAPINEPSSSPPPAQPESVPSPIEEPVSHPAPSQTTGPPLSSNPRSSGLSFAQALALCFISSLIFFVLGFVLGKSGAVDWEKIVDQTQKQRNRESPESTLPPPRADQDSEILITPLEFNTPAQEEEPNTASATLETFLLADTWGARNAYVLNSEAVLPMMAASAKIHGDGPIPFKSISLQFEEPNLRSFWIETSEHPQPFSVVLRKEGDWWLVDWLGFADFYYDRLGTFAQGREGPMKAIFRVLLKAAPGETSPLSPSRCLVRAPQSPLTYQVNSLAESPARRQLAEIFQKYLQKEPEQFNEAMADDGIPLILEISRTGAENPTLQLEKIITAGWAPLTAEQLEKDSSSRFY